MNNVIEFEGKTIDEAIEKACDEFAMPREKLNIEIVSEESKGFLGLGSKKAVIRARALSFGDAFSNPFEEGKTTVEKKAEDVEPEKRMVMTTDDAARQARAGAAQTVLRDILQRMDFDFPVTIEYNDEYTILSIQGDGSGILIGKGGQTLDALQYIVNKAVSRESNEGERIILDTENYREKRRQSLIALAEKLSEKAKRMRKPVVVNPMNAHDRRIIHLALQNDSGVTTKSRGEGFLRKIVIVPTKKTRQKAQSAQ